MACIIESFEGKLVKGESIIIKLHGERSEDFKSSCSAFQENINNSLSAQIDTLPTAPKATKRAPEESESESSSSEIQ